MPESEQCGAVLEKARKYSKIENSLFHSKKQKTKKQKNKTKTKQNKTSNGPMRLANDDLWLPTMVSK